MRGTERQQGTMFSYVSLEERIPADHPLRPVRTMVDRALGALSLRFDALYADGGRPSIPPEQLLRALLLQVLYTIRSERQLMEQLDYKHVVPLVRGTEYGRPHVGRDGVYQEPRAAAERRHRAGVLSKGAGTGARTESTVGGSLHGGRNVDRSLGGTKEFSTQRPTATTASRRRQQSYRELSRRETQQSDAPVHRRSGSNAVSE